ncbi:MAG: phosphoenolpyruvate carboxylase, partial [Candidatus Poribacteria bacterium]|nr:phosphoenolpyruvate carboxylase [Candidatus Poribacteria bacterium]
MSQRAFLSLSPLSCGLSEQLHNDVALLDRLLCELLEEQCGAELVELARRLYQNSLTEDTDELLEQFPELKDPTTVENLLRAYTMLFQLLNKVEQKEIIRVNRMREARSGGAARPESVRDAVLRLKGLGVETGEMQGLLNDLDINPTLTAHPTEARRRAVLDKLQTIAESLAESAYPVDLPRVDRPLTEAGRVEKELLRALTAMWQTDELRMGGMTVSDEVRNALYFFRTTIMSAVPYLHDDFRAALAEAYPGHTFQIPPFIKYRTWVGGDRDGNPNVTPDITWQTILSQKQVALNIYLARIAEIQRVFTQGGDLIDVTDEFEESMKRDAETVTLSPDQVRRFGEEPYVVKLLYIQARLEASLEQLATLNDFRTEGPSFLAQPPAYQYSRQFLADLRVIERSLRENHGSVLADGGTFAHLLIQVQTFGFHLASIDVRQHSDEHARALDELLVESHLLPPDKRYSELPEGEKIALLTQELHNPRPLVRGNWRGSETTQNVREVFEVVHNARQYISQNTVMSYIISMTHEVSDVLEVMLL